MPQPTPDDLVLIRARYPDWLITTVWQTAANGPDCRLIVAQRCGITLSAFTAVQIMQRISEEAHREKEQS